MPYLIKAASDRAEQNRVTALFALADTLDPAAIAELRHRLTDDSEKVRFQAACFLTEFKDASGLGEMKKALERLHTPPESRLTADQDYERVQTAERLLASFERITGKSFGPVPREPGLSSDLSLAEASRLRYQELLDVWAAWWAWEPAASNSLARTQPRLVEIGERTPLDFLTLLRSWPFMTCEIGPVPSGWVQEEQLADLFKFLDAEEGCASVVTNGSPPVAVNKPNTVGREAGFMIRSFRTQPYPVPLNTAFTEQDKAESRQWWADYLKQKK